MKLSMLAIFTAAFALIAFSVPPASAADAPTVTITDYTVSPSVLMPDGLGTITITIKNTATTSTIEENRGSSSSTPGTIRTTDVNVNIENIRLEGEGIKVLTADFDRVGEIGPGQSIPITFSIQAPTKNGMYYPEVWIDTTGGRSTRYPVPVNVNTAIGIQKGAILIMDSALTGDQNPGNEILVTVTLTNAGDMLADDVTLTVENASNTVATKSTNLYHFGTISTGEKRTVEIALLSDKNTPAGLEKIPVTIQYNAIDGKQETQLSSIDILFKGVAELGFVTVDTNPARLTEGEPFDLTIRIENTGTGEAKQVSATVNLPAEGKKEAFIGKIKPGNDAPAIFLLEGAPAGNQPYTLTVHYTDDMGEHTMTREMNLRVPPTDNFGTIIFGIVVFGILVFLGYRYWYRPKVNGDGKFSWERKS